MSDVDYVRRISHMSKAALVELIRHETRHTHHWIYGGPEHWSKDELVSYVVRNDLGHENA